MNDYLLFMDVSGDYNKELLQANDVRLVSMEYAIDDKTVLFDGDEKTVAEFYQLLKEGKMAKTSQITPFVYEQIFGPLMKEGHSIIYLCLSSGLSSTYESALVAKKNLEEKYPGVYFMPVDTLGATTSFGPLCERMIANKKTGMSIGDNVNDLNEFKHHIYTTTFVLDLMHLKRGGRIGAATAVVGTMFGIKPIIKITEDGKLEVCNKIKGERKAALYLASVYQDLADMNAVESVYISDSENEPISEVLKNAVLKINPKAVIKTQKLSPIIGTHLGPGSVVISFIEK